MRKAAAKSIMPELSAAFFALIMLQQNQRALATETTECCSQSGRIESARHLISQAEDFKLKASQFHMHAESSANSAKKLQADAKKLQADANKLQALSNTARREANKDFMANLQSFKDHANQYRSHLEQVEKDLGFCKESEAQYQSQLKQYSLHVEQFHIPSIRPPHICGQLQVSESQAARMANSIREDQMRLIKSEANLAAAEGKLENAMQASMQSDAMLLKRSKLTEAERKLSGEFAALKTEYELLNIQRSALTGGHSDSGRTLETVRWKLSPKQK